MGNQRFTDLNQGFLSLESKGKNVDLKAGICPSKNAGIGVFVSSTKKLNSYIVVEHNQFSEFHLKPKKGA
jgi:hypothetical protein